MIDSTKIPAIAAMVAEDDATLETRLAGAVDWLMEQEDAGQNTTPEYEKAYAVYWAGLREYERRQGGGAPPAPIPGRPSRPAQWRRDDGR